VVRSSGQEEGTVDPEVAFRSDVVYAATGRPPRGLAPSDGRKSADTATTATATATAAAAVIAADRAAAAVVGGRSSAAGTLWRYPVTCGRIDPTDVRVPAKVPRVGPSGSILYAASATRGA